MHITPFQPYFLYLLCGEKEDEQKFVELLPKLWYAFSCCLTRGEQKRELKCIQWDELLPAATRLWAQPWAHSPQPPKPPAKPTHLIPKTTWDQHVP